VVEEPSELPVHFLEHGKIEAALAAVAPFRHGRPVRRMDIVGPEIDVERFSVRHRSVDEIEGGLDEAAGDLRTLHPGHRAAEAFGVGPDATGLRVAGLEGERQEFRAHALEVGECFVETILADWRGIVHVALTAQMPFAEVTGGVAVLSEDAREDRRLRIEPLGHAAAVIVGPVAQVRRDAPALRVLACGDCAARRRADGGVDVELGEADSLGGQPVHLWRARVPVAEAREVAPAHVVNVDENDVRPRRGQGLDAQERKEAEAAEPQPGSRG